MAILDNAIWLTGSGGTAQNGNTVISEGGNSTTVTGTFTGSWDASQNGYAVSDFGAFGVSSPITADFDFSLPVEDLSFDFQHVNGSGSTYDDNWTIYAYDDSGNLIPASEVIAGLTGLVDENVITNPDGSVTIDSNGTTSNDVSLSLDGPISQLNLVLQPGPEGSITGGSGISDLTFTIPDDTDGDGVADSTDLDDDNDGILDTEEGYSETAPTTITITFDGDEYASGETSWTLYDASGAVIASDTTTSSTTEITNVSVTDLGEYSFVVNDTYGDGLAGSNTAGYTIAIDGTIVHTSAPNENFGTQQTVDFDVSSTGTSVDTDGDGIADHLDLDSDNDGITDNVEMQSTDGYIAPTGVDTDGDGVDDAYDATPTTGAAGSGGLVPVDTDGDGIADYLDTDSDNDGILDVDEAGHGIDQATIDASGDSDGDGIMDAVDDVLGWDVNDADVDGAGDFTLSDSDGDTASDGSGATPLVSDLDFRDNVTADGTVEGTSGADTIDGSYTGDPDGDKVDNNDAILPGDTGDDDLIYGYGGDDSISSGDGNDDVYGGRGSDVIDGGAGDDALYGGRGDDTINGGTGDDTIEGGNGDDTLTGGAGADTIIGGADQDVIYGGAGDVIDGSGTGVDNDTLIVSGVDYIDYDTDPENGTVYFTGGGTLTFTDIENVIVSDRDGTVSGTAGNDLIGGSYVGDPDGDEVDDTDAILVGHEPNDDLIEAGAGNDTIFSGAGDDTVYAGTGNDIVSSSVGDDTIFGEAGDDLLASGSGTDTIYGGIGDDTINGGTEADVLFGGDDDDRFLLEAGFGSDVIEGGEGGSDVDEVWSTQDVNVTVTATGDEAGTITDGTSTATFSEIESIETEGGDDTINLASDSAGMTVDSGAGDDTVTGGSGDDSILAGSGDDVIDGNEGADSISAGSGNDTITFSEGDTADGGTGDDLFVLEDLGEPTNGTITIDGGAGDETGGDTLQIGDLGVLTQAVRDTFVDDGTGSYSGSITLDDGTILNFSEIENIICFTPTTRIATPNGLVAIEDLEVGDMVVTRDHGLQPIRWIEGRTVPAVDRFAPIKIRKNVLAGQDRDLIVSPQHRVLFQGYRAELLFGESEVLVAAKHLVDGMDVTQDAAEMVTYIHMLFDQHEIIYAEGAATESFHPGDIGFSAVGDGAREELFGIFPELRADPRQYGSTARRCLKSHEAKLIRV